MTNNEFPDGVALCIEREELVNDRLFFTQEEDPEDVCPLTDAPCQEYRQACVADGYCWIKC